MKAVILPTLYRIYPLFMLTLAVVAMLILAGCGSSGSSGTSAVSTPGLSAGQIEGFGSVIVNGVKFEVEGAELEFEDGSLVTLTEGTQQLHLSEGMEVEIEGTFDDNGTGSASRMSIDSTLDGPISGLGQAGDVFTFTILGQTVVAVNGATLVDNTVLGGSLNNLADGMVIEVHGLPDGAGTVQASFIEWKAASAGDLPPNSFELTGRATQLTATTFLVGTQLVDFTGVIPRDGILQEGSLVEVKGDLDGTTFVAIDVELKDGFDDQAKTEIEGLISDLNTGAGTFMIRGQLVDYNNAQFMGGVEADLLNGLKVEAEGPISNGVLLAVKIKFKDNFRYEGDSSLLGNTLTIANPGGPDLTITIDSNLTRDGSAGAGGQVKVRARQTAGANLVATRVEDGGNADRQIFEAQVARIADPLVEILADGSGGGVIVIDTATILPDDSGSNFEIEDVETTRAAFFAALQVGDIVKARWDVADSRWDNIEIELDD
ncbi:MAG TPA: DUF5666 domain-containing protein [Geopsychrobacteraceae bacterium]